MNGQSVREKAVKSIFERADRIVDRPHLLASMGVYREAITRELARMQINGPLYYSASAVVAAIDGLTLMLTGQSEYFHLKGHGGGSGDV
jgi:hypothetical protein